MRTISYKDDNLTYAPVNEVNVDSVSENDETYFTDVNIDEYGF